MKWSKMLESGPVWTCGVWRMSPNDDRNRGKPVARKKSLNTYENQARISVIAAGVGALAAVATVALLARNFTDLQTFYVVYNPQTMYLPAVGVGLLGALACGTIGFFVGLNSAGQKRNTQSKLAWMGFFCSAAVITLALCIGLFFYFTRRPMTIG